MIQFSCLSVYRLRECSHQIGHVILEGKEFTVLRSNTTTPVTQVYVVKRDWEYKPTTSRIEPLLHLNIKSEGIWLPRTFQPDMFELDVEIYDLVKLVEEFLD